MALYYKGTVAGIRTGTFDKRDYGLLQFVEDQGNGSLKFIEVNLPDGFDHSQFRKGQHVELPVTVRAKDSKVFYRYVPPNVGRADAPKGTTPAPKPQSES